MRYAAGTLASSLGLAEEDAHDRAVFAAHQGFAVLCTRDRDECLDLGERLGEAGLDCRVVPRDVVGETRDRAGRPSVTREPSPVVPVVAPHYALAGWVPPTPSDPTVLDEELAYDDALAANLACELALDVVVDVARLEGRRPRFYEGAPSGEGSASPARIEVTSVPPSGPGRGKAFVEDTYLLSF